MKNICFHLNRKLWIVAALLLTLALPGFAQKITVHGYDGSILLYKRKS